MLKEPTEVIFLEIISYIVYFHCAVCLVMQLCLTLCDPVDCSPLGSSVRGDPRGKNTGVGCHACLQGSPKPRD